MKQLKTCCWKIINENKPTFAVPGQPSEVVPVPFNKLMLNLPKVLSKAMAENMSTPLAFYSVLHLANENGLTLTQTDDLHDFIIALERKLSLNSLGQNILALNLKKVQNWNLRFHYVTENRAQIRDDNNDITLKTNFSFFEF